MRFRLLYLLGMALPGASAAAVQDRERADYEARILPLLRTYCFECHAEGADEGGLEFDAYPAYADLIADHPLWEKAAQLLASHVMPPTDEPRPSEGERAVLLDWIEGTVFHTDPGRPDPGPSVMRRLSRAEYDNTLRDVFRIDLRPARSFPPDDSAHGYDHIGGSLSPLFLEKHLLAARVAVAEATKLTTIQQAGELVRGTQFAIFSGKPRIEDQIVLLGASDDEPGAEISLPISALYRIQLRAASTRPGGRFATFQILDGGKPIATFTPEHEFSGKRQFWDANLALVKLAGGRHRFTIRMIGADVGQTGAIHTFAVQGPYAPVAPQAGPFLSDLAGEGRRLGVPSLRLSGEDFELGEGKSSLDTGSSWFATRGYRFTGIALDEPGRYRFRVKAGAQQVGDEPVRFAIRLGGREVAERAVTAAAQQAQWIEVEADAPAGEHELQVWFLNGLDGDGGQPKRLLWLHELEILGPLGGEDWPPAADIPGLLEKAGRRIFRRPLTGSERSKLAGFVAGSSAAPLETFRAGLESLLSSPKFLFLGTDPQPGGEPIGGSQLVDEYTLASRLSYFLWSSCPDEALLDLAAAGQLRERLPGEVGRLLADPRSAALTEGFAGQWLQLRDLDDLTRDGERFPTFDRALAADMRRESELLFERILRDNRPVIELITADRTDITPRLATLYGIDVPAASDGGFSSVSLAGTPRRGLLGHAGILALTSHPTRTSPVNRGKFILEKILGTPPPPAPGDVPPLEETRVNAGTTLREQLEAHRASKRCVACHAYLDPMGFALENFDAIGRWRDTESGHPIDATGVLVTGEAVNGFAGLQTLLAGPKKSAFTEHLVRELLTYALGRGLDYPDKMAVRDILAKSAKGDHQLPSIIHAICESVPFQRMRAAAR